MIENYNKVYDALDDLIDCSITPADAHKVLASVPEGPMDSEEFYQNAMLDCESHKTQIAVILSLMGISSPTATDMDKAENIFRQIQTTKEL